jgi:hypothetical protein
VRREDGIQREAREREAFAEGGDETLRRVCGRNGVTAFSCGGRLV